MEQVQTYDKKYTTRALILFSAFVIIVLYIETMLVASLPAIALQFNVTPSAVSLVLSMYLVTGVALNPIVGKLGDVYGKKRVLKYILPIYIVAVAVAGFSPSFAFLVAVRSIQGIGLTIFPLLIALIQEEFPREQVPRSLAIITAMFGVGSAIGLPLGSFISNSFGWQFTYHTALPFVIAISVLMLLYIRESKFTRPDVKVDYIGSISLAVFLAMLVFAISEGPSYGFTSPLILGLLIGSVVIAILFFIYEKRIDDPVINFKLMAIKNVQSANWITLIAGIGYFFSYQAFAYIFESAQPLGFGYTIFQTGLAIAPFAVVNVIAAPIAGRYIPKIGVKPFFIAGSVIGIIGFLIASLTNPASIVIIGEATVGLGIALINIPTINLLVLSIDKKDMGLAVSMNSVFRFLGSAIGAPIAGVFIAIYASRVAFQYSFYVAIFMLIIAAILSLFADEIIGKNKKIQKLEAEVSI